jgi:ribose 5-phosphate isomerase RpiB
LSPGATPFYRRNFSVVLSFDGAGIGAPMATAGKPGIVSGLANKIQAALAGVLPDTMLVEMHRQDAQPKH